MIRCKKQRHFCLAKLSRTRHKVEGRNLNSNKLMRRKSSRRLWLLLLRRSRVRMMRLRRMRVRSLMMRVRRRLNSKHEKRERY